MKHEIMQIIPLYDRHHIYSVLVIGMALAKHPDGTKSLVYIEHDLESDRPVIRDHR